MSLLQGTVLSESCHSLSLLLSVVEGFFIPTQEGTEVWAMGKGWGTGLQLPPVAPDRTHRWGRWIIATGKQVGKLCSSCSLSHLQEMLTVVALESDFSEVLSSLLCASESQPGGLVCCSFSRPSGPEGWTAGPAPIPNSVLEKSVL